MDNKQEQQIMEEIPVSILEELKKDDTYAILLNYIIFNSTYYKPFSYEHVSLIHKEWAYPVSGYIYDNIIKDYPNLKIEYPADTSVSPDAIRFSYIKISLNMLPSDIVLTTQKRELWSLQYYTCHPKDFIIYSKYIEPVEYS
jgi:hypothetical protein